MSTDSPDDPTQNADPGARSMLVIERAWLVSAAVGLVTFLIGGMLGYFLALTAYQRGVDDARIAVEQSLAGLAAPGAAQAAQPTPLPARLDNVSEGNSPARGPADAPVVLVEFSDFRCPYCKRFHEETYPQLLEQYGDQIRFVYRHFPVVGGQAAALAAVCADSQGSFWEYHDALFDDPRAFSTADDFVALAERLGLDGDAFRACLDSEEAANAVIADYNDGRSYGINGTPTFFVNGVRIVGAQPLAAFQEVIDEELGN